MISPFTDYYCFQKIGNATAHPMTCTASTHSYDSFELYRSKKAYKSGVGRDKINIGDLRVQCIDPKQVASYKDDMKRKFWRAFRMGGNHLSGICRLIGDIRENNFVAYGDVFNTDDAVLFVVTDYHESNMRIQDGTQIEIFIARGRSAEADLLCMMVDDGEFDADLNQLREEATPDNPQQ